MKIKTILNNKKIVTVATGGVVLLALAGGGVYLSQKESIKMNNSNENKQNQSQTQTAQDEKANSAQTKSDSQQQSSNSQTNTAQPAQVSSSLDDVTLQGSLFDESGVISVSLYGGPGKYTIDKEVGNTWVNIVTDENYVGTGGLLINDSIPVSELSRIYRIYRTADGVKSTTKEITVDRNLIKDGSASFPNLGAL